MHNKPKKRRFLACPNGRGHLNKRGLSAIITTLLIVMLVLVAVGIVWAVVRGVIRSGTEGVGSGARCLNIDVSATAINCNTPSACVITFDRTGSDDGEIGGVKLVFFEGVDTSGVIPEPGNIQALAGKTITIDSKLSVPDKLEVTVYLEDESGNEQLCSQTALSNIGGSVGGGDGGAVCGDGTCNGLEICGETNNAPECIDDCESCPVGEPYCGDGTCNGLEICGEDNVAPACRTDCDVCGEEAVCGDFEVTGDEECDSGGVNNCIEDGLPNECTCEVGFIPDPESNGCTVDPTVSCDGLFEEGEQCDSGVGCILPGLPNECTCDVGYIPTVPPSADCEQITFIDSGTIDNVWPPETGIYFDDADLPHEDSFYYGNAVYFPDRDPANCYLIVGYSYDGSLYLNAIVELDLFEPLNIVTGDAYQIWNSIQECTDALTP